MPYKPTYEELKKRVHQLETECVHCKQKETELKKDLQFAKSLLEAIPTPIFFKNTQGRYLGCNTAYTEIMGFAKQELIGKTVQDLWPSEYARVYHQNDLKLIENPTRQIYEFEIRDKGGAIHPVIFSKNAFYDEHGNVAGIVGGFIDITERKLAEDALRKAEAKYRTILESIEDGYFEIDLVGNITFCNDSLCKILGYAKNELTGMSSDQFMNKENFHGAFETFKQICTSGDNARAIALELITKDGSQRFIEISISMILDKEGRPTGFQGIARDITVRKRSEENLRLSEERFRTVLQNVPNVAIQGYDMNGTIQFWNEASKIFYGYTSEEALGKNLIDLIIPPVMREEVATAIKTMVETGEPIHASELSLMRKDGSRLAVFSSHAILQIPGCPPELFCIDIDLTENKRSMEINEKLQAQLFQAQKMEAIGTLAGGIAHDFNNILSGIFGFSQLAKRHLTEPEKAGKDIDQIIKGAQKATELVQQILTVSRKSIHEKKPVPIYLIIKEALKLLRATIPTTIEIKENIVSQATVMADPAKIHQIIMNLCTNAYHAMRATGGNMFVGLQEIEFSIKDSVSTLNVLAGKYLDLEVSDTGHGMDSAILKRIFDPYFTTKEHGKGTGLGLAVAAGIVEEYKGYIRVHSEPGQGSTFHVYLPIVDRPAATHTPEKEEKSPLSGEETIMFVDDEEALRELSYDILKGFGYTVYTFSNGIEAFEAYNADSYRFDLVVTDMTMPGMTGLELSKRILELRPEQPIVLCTGYSETIDREKALSTGITEYVEKPFIIKALAMVIRKVLDEAKG